jgi:hypothetical protein
MPESKATRTRFEHANPILNVSDPGRSVRYYVDVLGFTNAEWGGDDFTCVSRDGASILQPPENFPWALEMKVGDPDGHVLRFGSDPKDEG